MGMTHVSISRLQTFIFINRKSCASHMMRRNPRETAWTVIYRRVNRKVRL